MGHPARHRPCTWASGSAHPPTPTCQPHRGPECHMSGPQCWAHGLCGKGGVTDCTQGRHTLSSTPRRLGFNRVPRRPPASPVPAHAGVTATQGQGTGPHPKRPACSDPTECTGPGVLAPGECPHRCKRCPERQFDRGNLVRKDESSSLSGHSDSDRRLLVNCPMASPDRPGTRGKEPASIHRGQEPLPHCPVPASPAPVSPGARIFCSGLEIPKLSSGFEHRRGSGAGDSV